MILEVFFQPHDSMIPSMVLTHFIICSTRVLTPPLHGHKHINLCTFTPLKKFLFHRLSPGGIHPTNCILRDSKEHLLFSPCRKRYICLLPLRYDTQPTYRNNQDSIKASKHARCQAVCLQRAKQSKGICNYCSLQVGVLREKVGVKGD